jgi:hypothetical protein
MHFRKLRPAIPAQSVLSPEDKDDVEQIRAELQLTHAGRDFEDGEIVDIALRRMWQDLNSDSRGELMEELQRWILYRQWCARNERSEPMQPEPVQPFSPGRNSI